MESSSTLYHLNKLDRILSFRVPLLILFGVTFFGLLSFVMAVLMIGVVVFTPVILWHLTKIGKGWWVVGFLASVGIPLLAAIPFEHPDVKQFITLSALLLGIFGYMWVLKLCVAEWTLQERWRLRFEAEDRLAHTSRE